MTEHRRYADLAAMAIDFRLDPIDAEDLRRHLEGCTACRRLADAMRVDASAMRAIDFGPAPVIVRERVAALAMKGQPDSPRLLLLLATGLLLLLAVFAGTAAVGALINQQRQNGPDLTQMGLIHWQTEVVDLRAADLWIEANGQRLGAQGMQVSLASDLSPDHLTLEATWQALGREVRLNFHFGGDATSWWVEAVEALDGRQKSDWAATKGTFFRTPLGRTWSGNVDIPLQDTANGGSSGVLLHVDALQLAIASRQRTARPNVDAPKLVKGNVFAPGGPLHCSGIFQMTPADAHAMLLKLGYSVSWRFLRDGFSEVRATPPDGVIFDGGLTGTSGEIIMFVVPAADLPTAPDPKIDFSDCAAASAVSLPKPG
jgi:hypothetical protein